MKKENIKQVLLIIIAIAIVSMIVGFVGYITFFDNFISYSSRLPFQQSLREDYYTALKPYFITVLVCLIATMLCFVVMFVINLTKMGKRDKMLINIILLGTIVTLSIVSIVASRLSVNGAIPDDVIDPVYNAIAYAYYETAFAQALTTTIPAIITAISMILYMFGNFIFKNCESEKEEVLKDEA